MQATESEMGDVDLTGLPETAVDSEEEEEDEEDIDRASDPLMSRDVVRECLEKDPRDRTDDDIGTIREIIFTCTFHFTLAHSSILSYTLCGSPSTTC